MPKFEPKPIETNEEQQQRELQLAKVWFNENPTKTKYSRKESGFASSYLKTDQGITRLKNKSEKDRVKAEGAFGKVKSTQRLPEPTVVKKQRLLGSVTLEFVQKEAKINVDLGIAASGLTVREFPSLDFPEFIRRYVYQELYDLGKPLSQEMAHATRFNAKQRLDLAIQLLLKVDDLHHGRLSKSGKSYAHRDIKPDNILVDADGNLTLIDFSFSSTELYKTNTEIAGTPEYLPIDRADFEKLGHEKAMPKSKKTLNYLVDDRIATLRTIYNPIRGCTDESIFNDACFSSLPQPLKNLLDTSTMAPHLNLERGHENVRFLAAVLILYKRNPNITQLQIDKIRNDVELQDALIEYHKNNEALNQIRAKRHEMILDLNEHPATQLLKKAENLLRDYQDHLYNQRHPVDQKQSREKYALISQCLDEMKDCETPQAKLAKIDEFLWESYSILSTARRREEKGLLNRLMNFFSRLFGHIKGKSVLESIEKSLDQAIGPNHQAYRKLTSSMRKLGFFETQEPTQPKGVKLSPRK